MLTANTTALAKLCKQAAMGWGITTPNPLPFCKNQASILQQEKPTHPTEAAPHMTSTPRKNSIFLPDSPQLLVQSSMSEQIPSCSPFIWAELIPPPSLYQVGERSTAPQPLPPNEPNQEHLVCDHPEQLNQAKGPEQQLTAEQASPSFLPVSIPSHCRYGFLQLPSPVILQPHGH